MSGTRVYIGGLPFDCQMRDLEDFVNAYGRTKDVQLKEGYAFIEFEDYRDADDAVFELNGKQLLGERVIVDHARPRRDRGGGGGRGGFRGRGRGRGNGGRSWDSNRSSNRLVVENLSSQITWRELKDYMREAGDVRFADAHKNRRNEGVVEFGSYSDMMNALETLDNTELGGRRIRLREERTRSRRSRSDSVCTIDTDRFRDG